MNSLSPLEKEVSINPSTNEKTIVFTGAGRLVGNLGSKEMTYTNAAGVEKTYRLATVKVNIPTIGEKNLLLQVNSASIEKMEDGVDGFESGEYYFTTVRPVKKDDGSGYTLLGNMSHKLHSEFEKYVGVYRFTDYNMNGQEYFLIILKSKRALLLYEESKERINLGNILDLYEQSYDTYEQMVINFETKPYESTLNRFVVTRFDRDTIEFESTYNQLYGFPTYQCIKLEAKFFQGQKDQNLSKLTLDSFSCHKNDINGEIIQKTQKFSEVNFSKFL